MKIKDCKKLVQHMIFSSKEDRFSKDELLLYFPEFVDLSRNNNDNLELYRVLMLQKDQVVEDFGVECTSKSIASCLTIADDMPKLIFGKTSMIELSPTIFKFKIPKENILIDYDLILPILKEKLKNVMNHSVYSKHNEAIKIEKAIQLYEENGEKEVIADLENIEYTSISLPKRLSTFSGKVILNAYEKNQLRFVYSEKAKDWIEHIKPILSEKEIIRIGLWLDEVENYSYDYSNDKKEKLKLK